MYFNEQYIVKVNYQKEDGYWVVGEELDIFVKVYHGENEKNNHDAAAQIARTMFRNCEVVSVKYC